MRVRIRKVKCDEGRPACHRCKSTGRFCDGYGIWGGGESFYRNRQSVTALKDVPRPPPSVSVFASGTEEKEYFEWFKCRTAIKLPGSFVSRFWDTLLFQASSNEPAVLHAVLALSSVHKRGTVDANVQTVPENGSNDQESSTLKHYIKAISHLKPHFSRKDKASFQVALITCVTFVYLEFLRGYFRTAQTHLQNGLKILIETHLLSNGGDGILRSKPCLDSTDDWIVEAFSRLHLQVELFKHAYQHPCLVLQAASPETHTLVFHSINEAWQQIGQLLNEVFYLTHLARQQGACECVRNHLLLLEDQQRIQTELTRWLDVYKAFEKPLQGLRPTQEEKGYQLLYTYHTMTCIMLATCLRPSDESAFDLHAIQFVLLIRQLTILWTTASTIFPVRAVPGDMSRSIVDMGWIPMLYYTAVKCRVHRIRLQAIRFLESTSHREGIWDAKTAACVARKVMQMEERDFYKDVHTADDFSLLSSPRPQDLSLPTLPKSHRIRDVEVVLSGDPMDRILLFCVQRPEGIDCRVLISVYSVRLQRWIDEKRSIQMESVGNVEKTRDEKEVG